MGTEKEKHFMENKTLAGDQRALREIVGQLQQIGDQLT
jgi:hypothetical protein